MIHKLAPNLRLVIVIVAFSLYLFCLIYPHNPWVNLAAAVSWFIVLFPNLGDCDENEED